MRPLTRESFGSYAQGQVAVLRKLQVAKECRAPLFPVVRRMLENPLEELVTTTRPTQNGFREAVERDGGVMLLYDGRCAQYLEDGVAWRKGKMSVKQILYEAADDSYRLKNHKSDKGAPVMRRQTWIQSGENGELRRHEYRLFERATIIRPEADGTMSRSSGSALQAFPVLVHYFRKGSASRLPASRSQRSAEGAGRKKKRERDNSADDDEEEGGDEVDGEEEEKEDLEAHPEVPEISEAPQNVFLLGELEEWFGATSKRFKGDVSCFEPGESGGILAHDDRNLLRDSSMLKTTYSFGDAAAAIMIVPDTTVEIEACVPDYAFRPVRVLAVVPGFSAGRDTEKLNYQYGCTFSDEEVTASLICDGVVSFMCPQRSPGVVNFWVWRKNTSTNQVEYTRHLPFFFLPAPLGDGHLSLAWLHLRSFPLEWAERFAPSTRSLNVANNSLENIDFAAAFPLLEELVADNNAIVGTSFPVLPRVKHLSLNRNALRNLDQVLAALKSSFPNLLYLSLLGNEVCPIFSSDDAAYERYLTAVLTALPSLKMLDSTNVEKWTRK